MYHPIDTFLQTHPAHAVKLALTPVLCTDCEQYVPLGWVEQGQVKCPKGDGWGHRVYSETITNIKDSLYNGLADAGLVEKIASVEIVRVAGKRGYGFVLSNALTEKVVEASRPNVFKTRRDALTESRSRARHHGFGQVRPDNGKTRVYDSADQFQTRFAVEA